MTVATDDPTAAAVANLVKAFQPVVDICRKAAEDIAALMATPAMQELARHTRELNAAGANPHRHARRWRHRTYALAEWRALLDGAKGRTPV